MIMLNIAAIYLLIGLVFALLFLIKGLHRIDAGAEGSGFLFKLLILPGVIAFWPFLANKWIRKS